MEDGTVLVSFFSYFLPWTYSMDAPSIRQFNKTCAPCLSKSCLGASERTRPIKSLTVKPAAFEFDPWSSHVEGENSLPL